jgi:diguanylate cyclase (GGDEF)-like protein
MRPNPIPSDNNDIAVERYWRFARVTLFVALGLHVMFAGVFALLRIESLLWLNLVSVSVYVGCFVLVARGMRTLATLLVWTEVIVHALITTRILGWDSGFQYYMWILAPIVFFSSQQSALRKMLFACAVIAAYLPMHIWLQPLAPLLTVPAEVLQALLHFNIVCYLGATGFIAMIYSRAVGETEKQLHALATTDTLTGLVNRRRLLEIAQYELARARRHERPLCVVLLDIDYFKLINDRFGHAGGDQVLIAVSQLLRSTLRTQDHLARWGGEEFLILMPEAELGMAQATAERIRQVLANTPLEITARASTGATAPMQTLRITATLGVSEWLLTEDFDHAIARADVAMYRGKIAGRNRVETGHHKVLDTPHAIAV